MDDARPQLFPAWLRRIDPLLENALDNGPFEAFCARGLATEERPRSLRRLKVLGYLNLMGIFFVLGSLPLVLILSEGAGIVIYVLLVVIVSTARRIARSVRVKTERKSLAETSLMGRRATREMTDLWICGVRGGDILKGVYTEYAVLIWRAMLTVPLLFAAGIASVLLFMGGNLEVKVVTGMVAIWFLYESTISLYISQIRFLTLNAMMPVLRVWSPNIVLSMATSATVRLLLGVIAVLCVDVVLWKALISGALRAEPGSMTHFFLSNSNLIMASVALSAWAAGLHLGRRRIRERNIAYATEVAARGDVAFDEFMRAFFEKGNAD